MADNLLPWLSINQSETGTDTRGSGLFTPSTPIPTIPTQPVTTTPTTTATATSLTPPVAGPAVSLAAAIAAEHALLPQFTYTPAQIASLAIPYHHHWTAAVIFVLSAAVALGVLSTGIALLFSSQRTNMLTFKGRVRWIVQIIRDVVSAGIRQCFPSPRGDTPSARDSGPAARLGDRIASADRGGVIGISLPVGDIEKAAGLHAEAEQRDSFESL